MRFEKIMSRETRVVFCFAQTKNSDHVFAKTQQIFPGNEIGITFQNLQVCERINLCHASTRIIDLIAN